MKEDTFELTGHGEHIDEGVNVFIDGWQIFYSFAFPTVEIDFGKMPDHARAMTGEVAISVRKAQDDFQDHPITQIATFAVGSFIGAEAALIERAAPVLKPLGKAVDDLFKGGEDLIRTQYEVIDYGGKIRLGPNTPAQRYQGPWTQGDLTRASKGQGPIDMIPMKTKTGKPRPLELHHADNMPGSAIHEVPPSHTKTIWHQKHNQGVTNKMRRSDTQLHWYMRGQEMGNN